MATSSTIPATDGFSGQRRLVTGSYKRRGKAIAARFRRGRQPDRNAVRNLNLTVFSFRAESRLPLTGFSTSG